MLTTTTSTTVLQWAANGRPTAETRGCPSWVVTTISPGTAILPWATTPSPPAMAPLPLPKQTPSRGPLPPRMIALEVRVVVVEAEVAAVVSEMTGSAVMMGAEASMMMKDGAEAEEAGAAAVDEAAVAEEIIGAKTARRAVAKIAQRAVGNRISTTTETKLLAWRGLRVHQTLRILTASGSPSPTAIISSSSPTP